MLILTMEKNSEVDAADADADRANVAAVDFPWAIMP